MTVLCPKCNSEHISGERRPNGNYTCSDCKHVWPMSKPQKAKEPTVTTNAEPTAYQVAQKKATAERADVDRVISLLERAIHETYSLHERIKECKVKEKLVQYKKLLKGKNKEINVLQDTLTIELAQWAMATYQLSKFNTLR